MDGCGAAVEEREAVARAVEAQTMAAREPAMETAERDAEMDVAELEAVREEAEMKEDMDMKEDMVPRVGWLAAKKQACASASCASEWRFWHGPSSRLAVFA